jgi:hypothetical protein
MTYRCDCTDDGHDETYNCRNYDFNDMNDSGYD